MPTSPYGRRPIPFVQQALRDGSATPPKPAADVYTVQPVTPAPADQPGSIAAYRRQAEVNAERQSAFVMRRQRRLVANGFNVAVDGVWGPQSQAAWSNFVERQRAAAGKAPGQQPATRAAASETARLRAQPKPAPPWLRLPTHGPLTAAGLQSARQAELRHTAAAQLAAERDRIAQLTQTLTADPTKARTATLHQIATVLNDPQAGISVLKPEGARIAQEWLNAHGHRVPIDGVYGRATHDALAAAATTAARRERVRQLGLVVEEIYKPSDITPGDHPDWWPLNTPVPKPGELLNLLQHGGVQALHVERAVRHHLLEGGQGFDQLKRAQLLALAVRRFPHGPAARQEHAHPGTVGLDQAYLQTQTANDPVFRAQAAALYDARNPEDFKARLAKYTSDAEQAANNQHKGFLSKALSAFGGGMHYLVAPGAYLRTALVWEAEQFGRSIPDSQTFRATGAPQEKTWADAQHAIDGSPAYVRFPYEVVVDPLNFVAPLRVSSTALRAVGFKAMGGYVLKHPQDAGMLPLKFEKGTWSKLALPRAIDEHLLGGYLAHYSPAVQRLHDFAGKMTELKPDLVARVRRSAVIQSRHLFEKPRRPVIGDARIDAVALPKEVRDQLHAGLDSMKAVLVKHPRYKPLIDTLIRTKASLFIDSGLTTHSSIGASVIARMAEETRIQVTHQIAADSYTDVINARSRDAYLARRHEEETNYAEAYTPDQVNAHMAEWDRANPTDGLLPHDQALDLAETEYYNVVDGAGAYLKGGSGDPLILAEVRRRQQAIMDEFETSVLPALHSLSEDAADQAAYSLWDDAGLWLGRGADEQAVLRQLGHEAFDAANLRTVPNPQFGVAHTLVQASEAVQDELGRATNRIYWRAAREQVGQTDYANLDVDQAVADAEREIQKAWEGPRADGHYYDTRETLQMPDLYIRHLDAAFGHRGAPTLDGPVGELARLASDPAYSGSAERAIGSLVWDLGARRPATVGHSTDRRFVHAGHTPEDAAIRDAQFAAAGQLRDAVDQLQTSLAWGFDHSVARQFASNGALWLALAHAQSLPLRLTYRALSGSLDSWIFATLVLRPGWIVRNVADNLVKSIMDGLRDPRLLFQGFKNPGQLQSLLDLNIANLRYTVSFLDKLFGTTAVHHIDSALEQLWTLGSDVLSALFHAQGVDVNEAVIEGMRLDPYLERGARAPFVRKLTEDQLAKLPPALAAAARRLANDKPETFVKRWRDTIWHVTGNMPEDYYKRVLYRDTVIKTMDELAGADLSMIEKNLIAQERATERIERVLFDYSKVTIVEDNLRFFFPFIQFWRKNTSFWARTLVEHPWLPLAVQKWEQERQDANPDWPQWMRRYVSSHEIIDAAAVIPGLQPIVKAVLPDDGMSDPLNFTSFGQLYRTIKGENPNLPADKMGWKIVAPLLDFMQTYGPGMNPLLRKPLEEAGIANMRSWQTVLPQYGPAVAFTRDYWTTERTGPAEWARVLGLAAMGVSSDKIASDFDYWTNMEVVGQQQRGEPIDRDKAAQTIRDWFVLQNLYGYFSGVYFRRANPSDIYLSKMWDDLTQGRKPFASLTPKQDALMKEWHMRKMDALSFQNYVTLVPLIQAYYRQGSYAAGEAYKQQHPEIIQYVDKAWSSKPLDSLARNLDTIMHTQEFFDVTQLYDSLDVAYPVKQQATAAMLTPALRKSWAKNDTPAQQRDKMIQGEVHRMLKQESDTYFAIPGHDYQAKSDFLNAHPELVRSWGANNSAVDDYDGILHDANAALRQHYFDLADAGNWNDAEAWSRAHPFLWEDTKNASHYDPTTGQEKLRYMSAHARAYLDAKAALARFFDLLHRVGKDKAYAWLNSSDNDAARIVKQYFHDWGGHSHSQHAADYLAAKPALDRYFAVPEAKRSDWLKSGSPDAKAVLAYFGRYAHPSHSAHAQAYLAVKHLLDRYFHMTKPQRAAWLNAASPDARKVIAYFDKYGSHDKTQHAVDYLRVKPYLNAYFHMPETDRSTWLAGKSEAAAALRRYFDKYASATGATQHAKDYLAVKPLMTVYFAMTKAARAAWLKTGTPEAAKLTAYFKKYSKVHQYERAFLKHHPELMHGTPEQALRLRFWTEYFTLTPDQRPAYVTDNADRYGVFVYGAFGEQELHDKQAAFQRLTGKLTPKQSAYLYAKPLLDFYFQLPKDQRDLFARANPEVGDYLQRYVHTSLTGNAATDKLVEQYFKLPPSSNLRSDFLTRHPEVQTYFNSKMLPAERALHAMLDQYFAIPFGPDRAAYLLQHPEIAAYFDKRRLAQQQLALTTDAFDKADPRLGPYFGPAHSTIPEAEWMRAQLRQHAINALAPETIGSSREREQYKPTPTGRTEAKGHGVKKPDAGITPAR